MTSNVPDTAFECHLACFIWNWKKILSNLNRQGFPIEWLRKRDKVNDMCCCRYLVLLLHLIAWYLLDLSDKATSVFAMQASVISLNGCFFLTMYITRGACLSIYMTWYFGKCFLRYSRWDSKRKILIPKIKQTM